MMTDGELRRWPLSEDLLVAPGESLDMYIGRLRGRGFTTQQLAVLFGHTPTSMSELIALIESETVGQPSTTDNWRTRFPGAGHAEILIGNLSRAYEMISEGDPGGARAALEHGRWERNVDKAGIPVDVLEEARRHVDDAVAALSQRDPQAGPASLGLFGGVRLSPPS